MTLTLPHDSCILVCDAKKALVLRNTGSAAAPALTVEKTMHAPDNPKTSEQGTEGPGKTHSPSGRRSANEPVDHHMLAEIAFAGEVAEAIEAVMKARKAPLFVAAPPKMLASLRDGYGHATKTSLQGEIDKDLTKLPMADILRSLERS